MKILNLLVLGVGMFCHQIFHCILGIFGKMAFLTHSVASSKMNKNIFDCFEKILKNFNLGKLVVKTSQSEFSYCNTQTHPHPYTSSGPNYKDLFFFYLSL
jgi:hypothetical protein